MHGHQRKERNCLNCGAFVQGKYCQDCGQANIEPKETFLGMVQHFFEDITHFDSKFFSSLKYLLFRPGFLSKQYVEGKRTKYLHPVRMYVFTSAAFFLLFFALGMNKGVNIIKPKEKASRYNEKTILKDSITKTILANAVSDSQNIKNQQILKFIASNSSKLSVDDLKKLINSKYSDSSFEVLKKNIAEDDSVEVKIGGSKGDGTWFGKKLKSLFVGDDAENMREIVKENFLHKMPYALFVSLPLLAFFLYLLYIRNKNLYFFHHGVFTIHVYIFNFFLLFLVLISVKFMESISPSIWGIIILVLTLWAFLYPLLAMKNFYAQGWLKTTVKYILVCFLGFIVSSIVVAAFFVLAIATTH